MTPRNAILITFAAALLASCRQEVTCDYKGYIAIPEDASLADEIRWKGENGDLLRRRMDAALDTDGQAQFYTKEGLEKAASCP